MGRASVTEFYRRAVLGHSQACDPQPEPTTADDSHLAEVAEPVESATEYAQRKARENIAHARDLDHQHFDAMRRAGVL